MKEVPISSASKPHPVIVPLKTPEIKPTKPIQPALVLPNPKTVDIKIGITPISKIAATTVASATVPIAVKKEHVAPHVVATAPNGNLVFTVKQPADSKGILIPISNVLSDTKIPAEKQQQTGKPRQLF